MKNAFRYGLIYSAINILWSLIMYITDLNRSDYNWIFNTITFAFPVILIVLSVKEFKATEGKGYISFSQVFKQGILICLIGGLVMSAYTVVYMEYIDPTFQDFISSKQVMQMEDYGMSDDAIEKSMERAEEYQKPFWIFTFGLLGTLFMGTVISLIMAAVLKRPNPEEIS